MTWSTTQEVEQDNSVLGEYELSLAEHKILVRVIYTPGDSTGEK